MFVLRPYQDNGVTDIRHAFLAGTRRVILESPTGSGKTVTFVSMAAKAITTNKIVMILCDRKELIKQAKAKLNELGLFPTLIAPGYKQGVNNVYLASVDTLRRRDFPKIDLLIIDEAHKQSFDNVINKYIEFCNPYIIGATATPLRTGSQNCLSTIYQKIVSPTSISELLGLGYLVPAKTFSADDAGFDDIDIKGNDFDNAALYKKFDTPDLYDGVVDNYLKFAKGEKAICFNVNVKHSKKVCQSFLDAGISAAHIDGKTPEFEREDILKRFKNGSVSVLCNCSVLTTGFDEPSIECVIVNRATLSLSLWLQMCGRGSRTFEGKNHFVIIDQGANWCRHGLWEEYREWSLIKKKKREGDGVAPVKCCEKCDAINFASATKCKECGEPFLRKIKELKEARFIEVSKRMAKRGAVSESKIADIPDNELDKYGKEKGYKPGWAYNQRKIRGII